MLSILVLLFADDTVLLFADDTVLFATTPEQLQQCLVDCNTYCKTWQLAVNINKTKIKVFGSNKRNLRNVYFTLNGKDVEIVDKYKYRGIFFTSNGRFIKAQTYLITQVSTAMYLLYRHIYNLNLPIDLQLKLFDNTLVPILTLSSELWGFKNLNEVEKLQVTFLHKITKSRKSTHAHMLYEELGRYPLYIIIKCKKYNDL